MLRRMLSALLRDRESQEIVEHALVTAMVAFGAIATVIFLLEAIAAAMQCMGSGFVKNSR